MIYCYETKAGRVYERFFKMGKAPRAIRIGRNRILARRSWTVAPPSVPAKKGWPIECYASGVHADQADDLRNHFKRAGVPTEVTSDGDPVYTDLRHQRKALKCRKLVDKSSYV